jgi:hypothetical protein
MTHPAVPNSNRLPILAAKIRAAHDAVTVSARTVVERAREAGNLLLEAKEAVPHGGWQPWLREIGITPRTAQGYMQIARLPETECATVAHLGLRAALRQISSPRRSSSAEAFLAHWAYSDGEFIRSTASGKRIIMTKTGMELPPDLSFEEWLEIGLWLGDLERLVSVRSAVI